MKLSDKHLSYKYEALGFGAQYCYQRKKKENKKWSHIWKGFFLNKYKEQKIKGKVQ